MTYLDYAFGIYLILEVYISLTCSFIFYSNTDLCFFFSLNAKNTGFSNTGRGVFIHVCICVKGVFIMIHLK